MTRTAAPHRFMRTVVVAGAVVTLAGGVAACGASNTPAAQASTAGAIPGLTDDTVSVGYTVVDGGASVTDEGKADATDPLVQAKVIQAYVAFVNAAGGAGGRQIVPQIEPYASVTGSAEQARTLCSAFTAQDRVFAVVLDGQYDESALDCYRDADTVMVDESLVGHDTTQFEQDSPYLWSPTQPEYSGFLTKQLQAMHDEGFFDGSHGVQIVTADTAVARRATENVVQPFLASIGVESTEVSTVNIANSATLAGTTATAIAAGDAGGYDRVITVGGGPTTSVALSDAGADAYQSTWGVSSFDSPQDLLPAGGGVSTARLVGSSGLGYAPAYDVADAQGGPFPDPSRPSEELCKGVLDAAGIQLGTGRRADYATAFQYCDATLFLKAALDHADSNATLTGPEFAAAVGRIGTGYSSSLTFGSGFQPGQYAATNAGRVLTFDASCACFTYKGGNVPITK